NRDCKKGQQRDCRVRTYFKAPARRQKKIPSDNARNGNSEDSWPHATKEGGKQDGSVVSDERRGRKNKWIKYNSKDGRDNKNRDCYSIRQKVIFKRKIGSPEKMEFACEKHPPTPLSRPQFQSARS